MEALLSATFEKLVSGVLSNEVFQNLSGRYSQEQAECRERIPSLEGVDLYLDIQELTLELLLEFVDRMVVHERSER